MREYNGRELHIIKRALAVALAALEKAPDTEFRPNSDIADMKVLLGRMIRSDAELESVARSARLALTGKPDT